MSNRRDAYEILGVSKTADAKEIKSAYRKMAVKYHPDRNPGDESAAEMSKQVDAAWKALGKPEQRAIYDKEGWGGFDKKDGNSSAGPGLKKSVTNARDAVRGKGARQLTQDEIRLTGKKRGGGSSLFSKLATKPVEVEEEILDTEDNIPAPLQVEWVKMETMLRESIVEALRENGETDLANMLESAESEADEPEQSSTPSKPSAPRKYGR